MNSYCSLPPFQLRAKLKRWKNRRNDLFNLKENCDACKTFNLYSTYRQLRENVIEISEVEEGNGGKQRLDGE